MPVVRSGSSFKHWTSGISHYARSLTCTKVHRETPEKWKPPRITRSKGFYTCNRARTRPLIVCQRSLSLSPSVLSRLHTSHIRSLPSPGQVQYASDVTKLRLAYTKQPFAIQFPERLRAQACIQQFIESILLELSDVSQYRNALRVGQIMHPAKHPLLPASKWLKKVIDLQRREFSSCEKHQRLRSAVLLEDKRLNTLQSPIRTDISCCRLAPEELNRIYCKGKTTDQPWQQTILLSRLNFQQRANSLPLCRQGRGWMVWKKIWRQSKDSTAIHFAKELWEGPMNWGFGNIACPCEHKLSCYGGPIHHVTFEGTSLKPWLWDCFLCAEWLRQKRILIWQQKKSLCLETKTL